MCNGIVDLLQYSDAQNNVFAFELGLSDGIGSKTLLIFENSGTHLEVASTCILSGFFEGFDTVCRTAVEQWIF